MLRRISVVVVALAMLAVAAGPASAGVKQQYTRAYKAVKDKHGAKAPGRNIRAQGVKERGRAARSAKPSEYKKSTRTLKRMLFPGSGLLSPVPPPVPPAGTATLRATGGPLASIRACESGGNYRTNTGNGYYGAYQYDIGTWNTARRGISNAPRADLASPAEQDAVTARWITRGHRGAWPNC